MLKYNSGHSCKLCGWDSLYEAEDVMLLRSSLLPTWLHKGEQKTSSANFESQFNLLSHCLNYVFVIKSSPLCLRCKIHTEMTPAFSQVFLFCPVDSCTSYRLQVHRLSPSAKWWYCLRRHKTMYYATLSFPC